MSFPALDAVEAKLRKLFDAAGADLNLKNIGADLLPADVKAGDTVAIAQHIKALNDERESLINVQAAAQRSDGNESGDGASRQSPGKFSGGNLKGAERLTKGQSVVAWLKANKPEHAPSDVDTATAWDAWAKGLIRGDWADWQSGFAAKAMSTGEPGGGYLVPDVLSASVIDRMRSLTPIFLAGAQTVPMTASTLDIARVTGDPAATWHAESAAITPADVTLDRVRFTARTLPFIVKVSRELAEDASNLGAVVEQSLAGAVGVELTRVALRGSGTPPEPTGIRNASGVTLQAIGANGGALTIDLLIDAFTSVATNNANPEAMLWHPRTAGAIAKVKDSANAYIALPEPLASLPRFTTTAIPTNLTKGTGTNLAEVYVGQWSELMIGMRTTLRIETLRERYADTGEYAFSAWLRADVQLAHGASFTVIPDTTS